MHVWDMAQSDMGLDSFIHETWLIHIWHMTHSIYETESCVYATWLIHMNVCIRHDSFTYESWLIHTWDMTHPYQYQTCLILYVRHDSFIWTYASDMTHSHMRHDSFIHDTWLILYIRQSPVWMRHDSFVWMYVWDMTHSHMRHDSSIHETWLIHIWHMTHSIYHSYTMCDMTPSCVGRDSHIGMSHVSYRNESCLI